MKPYYDHAGIIIYHGDCREVLPTLPLATVFTDPPYNIGYHYDSYKDSLAEEEYRELISSTVRPPSVVLHYPEDMFGIFSALNELPEKCVAWTYNANTPRQWRMVAWFGCFPDFSLVKQPYKNPTDSRIQNLVANGSEGCNLYDWWNDEQVKNVSEEKNRTPLPDSHSSDEENSGDNAVRADPRPLHGQRHDAPRCEGLRAQSHWYRNRREVLRDRGQEIEPGSPEI